MHEKHSRSSQHAKPSAGGKRIKVDKARWKNRWDRTLSKSALSKEILETLASIDITTIVKWWSNDPETSYANT